MQGSVSDMNAKPDCLYNKQLADSAIRRDAGVALYGAISMRQGPEIYNSGFNADYSVSHES